MTTPPTGVASNAGRVYDRGYRPFEGVGGGRRASVLALFKLSIRRALGLRRSWRQKFLPWTLLAIAAVPAVVQVGVQYLTRDSPAEDFDLISYREYVGHSTSLLLFVAIAAPDVICPDLRQRTLPLIFSRPLTALDYVMAKVGAMVLILFGFSFLPQLVLFLGEVFVSDAALDYIGDNIDVLWQVPISVALLAFFYGSISIAVSSLTDRRLIAAAIFLVAILVSLTVSSVMVEVSGGFDDGASGSLWALTNIAALPLYLRDLVFLGHIDPSSTLGGVPGGGVLAVATYVLWVAASWAVLWLRYGAREVR